MTTRQVDNLTKLLESEMGEHKNYGLSDDRPPLSYIDDFGMGDIAYGAYPPFDTNAVPVPYMDDLGISGLGADGVLYHGTWEDENDGLGIHASRAGVTAPSIAVGQTWEQAMAAPIAKIDAAPKTTAAAMVENETEQRNRVLLWGGLAIAALMFLGPK